MKKQFLNRNKKNIFIHFLMLLLAFSIACGSDDSETEMDDDNEDDEEEVENGEDSVALELVWNIVSEVPEDFTVMWSSVSFTIDDVAYFGTGRILDNSGRSAEFWKYDPTSNSWTRLNDYGGGAVSSATSFSIGDYGYVHSSNLGDNAMWQYNPEDDEWTNLGATEFTTFVSVGFSIGSFGYLLDQTGKLWQFDPADTSYTEMASYPLDESAWNFSVATSAFAIVGGGQISGQVINDAFLYDPADDEWTEIANLPKYLSGPIGFSLSGEDVYVGAGGEHDSEDNFIDQSSSFYSYNSESDEWEEVISYPGIPSTRPVSFTVDGKGYIFYGSGASLEPDLWELGFE